MADTLLRNKILEKYQSVRYFCFLNNIHPGTLYHYCTGEMNINSMKLNFLNNVCNGLDCEPSDIGYTKEYWYTICPDGKFHFTDSPLTTRKQNK